MADRINIGIGPRLGFDPTDTGGFEYTGQRALTASEYGSRDVNFQREYFGLPDLEEQTGIGTDAPDVGEEVDVTRGDDSSGPETDLIGIIGDTNVYNFDAKKDGFQPEFGYKETGGSEFRSYSEYLEKSGKMDRVNITEKFFEPLSQGRFKDIEFSVLGQEAREGVQEGVQSVRDAPKTLSEQYEKIKEEGFGGIRDRLEKGAPKALAGLFSSLGGPFGGLIGSTITGTEQLDGFGKPSLRPSGPLSVVYDIRMSREYDIMNNIRAVNSAYNDTVGTFGMFGDKVGNMGYAARLGGGRKILRDVGSFAYFDTGGLTHQQAKNIEAFSKGYMVDTYSFDEKSGTDFFGREKNVKVEDAGGVFAGRSGYYKPNGSFYSTRYQSSSRFGTERAQQEVADKYGVPLNVVENAIKDARAGVGTVKGNIDKYKSNEIKREIAEREKFERDLKEAQKQEEQRRKDDRRKGGAGLSYDDDSDSGDSVAGVGIGGVSGSQAYGGGYGGGMQDYGGIFAQGGTVGMAAGGAMAAGMGSGFVDRPPSQVPEEQTVADDVETQMPEGAFVINAAAVEFAGEQDIKKMLNDAQKEAVRRGITIDNSENSTKLIDVAISRGEVTVAPYLAKIIGYDRLNKINNRGKPETKERLQEAAQGGMLGMAEGGVASPTRRPKREQLADIELRADLETFIQGDALARLGYKLYEDGHVRFNTVIDPNEYTGRRTKFKGAYFPPGDVRTDRRGVIPIRDIGREGKIMELQGIAPSQLKSDAGRVVLAGNMFDAPKKKGSDTLYNASETTIDMITIAHEFRHAALDYLSKTYDLGLPTLRQEERIMDYADNQAIERAGKVNPKLKERYFSNPDYELMSERGKSAGDSAYLRKQYEQYTGLAEEILEAMDVPPQSPAVEKEGFLTRTYKSLVN